MIYCRSTLIDKGKGLTDEHSNEESNEEVPNENNSSNKEVLDEVPMSFLIQRMKMMFQRVVPLR